MANETTAAATNGVSHGVVAQPAAASTKPKSRDRKPVPAGKVARSPAARHEDRASVERLAADVAAASAEAREAREQAAAESAAREALEATLATVRAEADAMRLELAAPVLERVGPPPGRPLPFGDIDDPTPRVTGNPEVDEALAAERAYFRKIVDGATRTVPSVTYDPAANMFRPMLAVAVRVVEWARADMIEIRPMRSIVAYNPYGTGEAVEVEAKAPVLVEVDASFDYLARALRACSTDALCAACVASAKGKGPHGPHALYVAVVPDRQVVIGGHVRTVHDVRIVQDFGPGSAAEHV